jgi:hypothetical protein
MSSFNFAVQSTHDELAENYTSMINACISYYRIYQNDDGSINPNDGSPELNAAISETRKLVGYRYIISDSVKKIDIRILKKLFPVIHTEYYSILRVAEEYTHMINECIGYYGENSENGMLNHAIIETRKHVGHDIDADLVKTKISTLKIYLSDVQKAYDSMLKESEKYTHMINECIAQYGENPERVMLKLVIDKTKEVVGNNINFESVKNNMRALRKHIPYLQKEYDLMISRKAANYRDKTLNPSTKYPPLKVPDFDSVRSRNTTFDSNFKIGSPDTSIVIYIDMHGAIELTDRVDNDIRTVRNINLNKYNISGTGQCTYNTPTRSKYMIYSLSDAVQKDEPLDISTMLREGSAYMNLDIVDPVKTFNETQSMKIQQTIRGSTDQESTYDRIRPERESTTQIKRREESIYDRTRPEGEETTYGNRYAEKIYQLGSDLGGIFICSEWPEIGAGPMDNLLENDDFNRYMLNKYGTLERRERERVSRNRYRSRDDVGVFALSRSLIEEGKEIFVMDGILLTDILLFCEMYGRPNINIVDYSCSVFTNRSGHVLTARQIDMLEKRFKKLDTTVAKGVTKKNKTNKKKGNQKTNKKKGNQKTKRRY